MPLNNPILDTSLNTIGLEGIKQEMGPPNWSRSVVMADHVAGVVICQNAGTINDNHCHNYDEWWIVLEGRIDWVIENRDEPVRAQTGDFVYVPALIFHHIFPKGDGPSVRLGIALPGTGGHLHERPTRKVKVSIKS